MNRVDLEPKALEAAVAEGYALGVHETRAAQIVSAYLSALAPQAGEHVAAGVLSGEDRKFALTAAAQAFCNRGISIACPWEGDLDDLEQDRFDALVAAIGAYNAIAASRIQSSLVATAVEDQAGWRVREKHLHGRQWRLITDLSVIPFEDRDLYEIVPVYTLAAAPPAVEVEAEPVAWPKERVCIPDPHTPGARIVGFCIREGDEAWGEMGLSEPLAWLERSLYTSPVRSEVTEATAALRNALEAARTWHESEDKALSKQPPSHGPNGNQWARLQHQEQIAEINSALTAALPNPPSGRGQ